MCFFVFLGYGDHRDLHVLTPSFPTRRSACLPVIMRDTIHCLTCDEPRQKEIEQSVRDMLAEVQKYVPGYKLVNGPVFDGQRVTTFMQVEGLGRAPCRERVWQYV